MSTVHFRINNIHFEGTKSPFNESYNKQDITRVVISYDIYETHRRLVSLSPYEMTTRERTFIQIIIETLLEKKY